jgi:putative DNA primase/helicase
MEKYLKETSKSIKFYNGDKYPLLLGVVDDVIDLSSGLYGDSESYDYDTRSTNEVFHRKANCPSWKKFVKESVQNDKELYKFIKRALGYSIIGHNDLQLFFMIVGSNTNGKDLFLNTVRYVMGAYATYLDPYLLTPTYASNFKKRCNALANLYDSRMTICTKCPMGIPLDETFIKEYVSGCEVTARYSNGKYFTYKPNGKLWISSNGIPEISASDAAIWRSIKPIPFYQTYTGANIRRLERELVEEYPGILNWLVKGAKDYVLNGLGSCEAVENLTFKMRHNAAQLNLP